jgi:hypothetical protein
MTPLTLTVVGGAAVSLAASSPAVTTTHLQRLTTHATLSSGQSAGELRPAGGDDVGTTAKAVANRSAHSQAKPTRGTPPPSGVTGSSLTPASASALVSIEGLDHRDQRLADGGDQWSLVPPDQALCASSHFVVEAVNNAVAVYDTTGAPVKGPTALNPFLGFSHEVVRNDDGTLTASPDQVGDPSCIYDQGTDRFYLTVYDSTSDADGNPTGPSAIDIAVSNTADPTKDWTVYRLSTTDDGRGSPGQDPKCPCFADYPHIGADATGFYITTNSYPQLLDGFEGANVYAIAKADLDGTNPVPRVLRWSTGGMDNGLDGFTLAPALAAGGNYAGAHGGTMYFLSSNAGEEVGSGSSTSIALWSLTSTSTLTARKPALSLSATRVTVPKYATPPASNQKAGSVPLADCLNVTSCAKLALGTPDKYKESEFAFDSSDTRMLQSAYANGRVWGALDTAVDVNGVTKAGVAYFIVDPTNLNLKTGTVVVPNNNISYPALGVTSAGKAVMALTLVGADYYPSAAYVRLDDSGALPTSVNVLALGAGPSDDFSGYRGFQYNQPRWGDYGAASVVGTSVWIASEYIAHSCTLSEYTADPFGSCGGTRTALANWSTHIAIVSTS